MSLDWEGMEGLAEALRQRGILPDIARYRYWSAPDGTQFHYTVERLADGKYASAVYVPKGKGARSGKPAMLVARRIVHHSTRRAAKARAYRLYQQHLEKKR